MADTISYETSSLDWNALRDLAVRTAQQTPVKPAPQLGYFNRDSERYVQLLGPHWVLDRRSQVYEEHQNQRVVDGRLDDIYALLTDGTLMYVSVMEVTWLFPNGALPVYKDDHAVSVMTESDVRTFDFAKDNYPTNGGSGDTVVGTLGLGELIHTTKGAGLTELLRTLLDGYQVPESLSFADVHRLSQQNPRLLYLGGSIEKFHEKPDQTTRSEPAQPQNGTPRAVAKTSPSSSPGRSHAQTRRVINAAKAAGLGLILALTLANLADLPSTGCIALIVIATLIGAAIRP